MKRTPDNVRYLVPKSTRDGLAASAADLAEVVTSQIKDLPTRAQLSDGFSVDLRGADFETGLAWIASMIASLPSQSSTETPHVAL